MMTGCFILKLWGFLSLYMLYSHHPVSAFLRHNTYESRDDGQMESFGADVGDESFTISELPVTVNNQHKMIFNKGKFDQIKIYADGRVELLNKNVNIPFTPNLTPYQPWYSQVTSGRVWFRESEDKDFLDKVQEEIQTKLQTVGANFKPKSVKVITWQLQDIEPQYPECDPENRSSYKDFCNCVDFLNHLSCETEYLISTSFSHDGAGQCLSSIPDYRYCDCLQGMWGRAFDTPAFCYCLARGNSPAAGSCVATTYNPFGQMMFPPRYRLDLPNACELCECERGLGLEHTLCICRTHANLKDIGLLRCFLLYSLDILQCVGSTPCQEAKDCLTGNSTFTEGECDCISPETLTEPELMGCLLKKNHLSYIWLCSDPDAVDDLEYCPCIAARSKDDANDEMYCRCLALTSGTGADLCDCLNQWGYTGSEGACGTRKRQTLSSAGNHLVSKRRQNRAANNPEYLNIFQLVIVHGSRDTFVYFNYKKLKFININIRTMLGSVDDATQQFSGFEHPYTDIFFLHFLMWRSNVGVDGRWMYKVDRNIWGPPWTPETYSGIGNPSPFGR